MSIYRLLALLTLIISFTGISLAVDSCASVGPAKIWTTGTVTVCIDGDIMFVQDATGDLFKIQLEGDFEVIDTNGFWQSGATTGDIYFDTSGGEKIGFGTSNPTYDWDVVGDIGATGNLYVTGNLYRNGTPLGSSTDSYWSTASANRLYWETGNVGIGTSSPSASSGVTLHQYRSGELTSFLQSGGSNGVREYFWNSVGTFNLGIRPDGNFHVAVDWPDESDYSKTKLFINHTSGNVGIGTTSPATKLDVSGTVALNQLDNNAQGETWWIAGNSSDAVSNFILHHYGAFGDDTMAFGTGSATRMLLDESGNLGVGSTSPGSYNANADNLVIYQAGNSGLTLATTGTYANSIYFADGTSPGEAAAGGIQYSHADDSLNFSTAGNGRLFIDSTGNIGVSTAAPAYLFHSYNSSGGYPSGVFQNGGGLATLSISSLYPSTGDDGAQRLVFSNPKGNPTSSQVSIFAKHRALYFKVGGEPGVTPESSALVIHPGSEVTIGTTSPTAYALYVAGDALASGMWVSSDQRFKTNITTVSSALSKYTSFRGVKYDWIDSGSSASSVASSATTSPSSDNRYIYGPGGRKFSNRKQLGLLAQEVQSVIPEAVMQDLDGYYAVNYNAVTALNVQAIKELTAERDQLKTRVEELESQVAQILQQLQN